MAKTVAHSTSKKTGRGATEDAIEDATCNVSIQGSTSKFYISLAVHLGIILVNNQIDALFQCVYLLSLLYMFRAAKCSSSEESNCVNTSSGIYHSVKVTAWYAGQAYQAFTYTDDIYHMMY